MEITTIIVDDFLENPNSVRDSALKSDIIDTGNFPGFRSDATDIDYSNYIKSKLERILNTKIVEWIDCFNYFTKEIEEQATTKFQICFEGTQSWVHTDPTEWSAILYLTPDAPLEAGTAFYKHKLTGIIKQEYNDLLIQDNDSAWEIVSVVGNVYNRLVLFKGQLYHKSLLSGFGHDKYSARLTQVFFFNTSSRIIE
jgi:hypothetical protein